MEAQPRVFTKKKNPSDTLSTSYHLSVVEPNSPPTPEIDHWVVQLWGVEAGLINNSHTLTELLEQNVARLNLTQVSHYSFYFGPGVSTVIILSESHLSAHTWPETGYMHLDLVTCVKKLSHAQLHEAFSATFTPENIQLNQLLY